LSAPAEDEKPSEFELWDGSLQFGMYGAEGSSRTFNLRLGAHAQRKAPCGVLTMDLNYHRGTRGSEVTAHRLFFEGRHEWVSGDSPWTEFVQSSAEYNEMRPYDARVTADSGLGYRFVNNDTTQLSGRVGGGVVHEFGREDARPMPEVVGGLDLEHRFSKRHKLKAGVQYARQGNDLSQFTVSTRADWEVVISEEKNLSLNFSVEDRLHSWQEEGVPDDVDYSATLMWKF
jgi:putative salt-induced outer membrane protein YdiY